MKIISLFTKVPQHQRFRYKPLYYDAQKEEMRERMERARNEAEAEQNQLTDRGPYKSRIIGSLQAARKRSKPNAELNSVLMRFGAMLFITLLLIAVLQWGKIALYGGLAIIPFYLFMRFKKN